MFSSFSPLAKTMLFGNFAVLLLFLAPYFWPLPGELSRPVKSAETTAFNEIIDATNVDISTLLSRPLFQVNRRQAKAAELKTVNAPVALKKQQLMPFELVGILGSKNNQRKAYLFNKNSQQTLSVLVGQSIGGWVVVEISERVVIIESEESRRTLELTSG